MEGAASLGNATAKTDEPTSNSPNIIARTYHSVIETCQSHDAKAVIKRFQHQDNPRTTQRWRNEVDALELVGLHSNITQILASDAAGLTITLRQEPGRSLDLYINPSNQMCTLSAPDAEVLWRQMSGALAHLHAKSIIHDDVKPGNIIWDGDGQQAVLIDFGAALVNPETLPKAGWTPSGTPPYAPPEFFQRRKDKAGDVWGLGVTMLFAFGYVPLPDGSWILPHVFEDDAVRGEMAAWLAGVESWREKLCGAEDRSLLAAMLEADPDARIRSDELARRLGV